MLTRYVDLDIVWKVRKITEVNIELVRDFDVENIPVEAQNNQSSLRSFIVLRR